MSKRPTSHSPLIAVLLIAAVALLGAQSAWGAIVPDPTFGTNGVVTTPIGSNPGDEDVALALAMQSDGKLVVAGGYNQDEFSVARYNTDGSLDTSFGAGGKVLTDLVPTGTDEAHAVAVQPDGKIVVAGFADALVSSGGNGGEFGVVRYNANGTLDTTFGTGGKVLTSVGDFGGPAFAMALQSDGKIVVAGRASTSGGGGQDFAVVRYNANGTLDTGFDSDGMLMTDVGGASFDDQVNALAIQSDGKIVAAGYANSTGSSSFSGDFALVRYNANGSLDTGFDGDGKVTTPISTYADPFNDDEANALVIQPDGKLVAAGFSQVTPNDQFSLARYNTNGSLDTGFDGDGKVTTAIGSITSVAYGLALQADGKLVAAGRSSDCSTGQCHQNLASARYAPDGSLDPSYGGNGKIVTPVAPDEQTDVARAVAIQSDGKVVVVGYADMGPPEYYDYDFALVRYVDVPETTITSGPMGPTNDSTPTFGFSSDEPGSTFQCRFDGDPFGACSGPGDSHTPGSSLSDGPHTFEVEATNTLGNTDPTPALRSFTVDTTPPQTTIDSGPSGPTNDSTPTFSFSSDEGVSTFACRVDANPFAPCTSPHTTAALAEGPHTFEVRATDPAGNTDPTPATQGFSVATPPPPQPRDLSLSAKPKKLEKGDRVKLTGTLTGCTAGSVIEFQKKKAGNFSTFAAPTTGDDCKASVKRKVKKKTTFRAHTPSEPGFVEATSPQVTVKVKPPA